MSRGELQLLLLQTDNPVPMMTLIAWEERRHKDGSSQTLKEEIQEAVREIEESAYLRNCARALHAHMSKGEADQRIKELTYHREHCNYLKDWPI
jgi:hypothetical protein